MSLQTFPGRVQVWLATTGLTLALGAAVGAAGVLTWEHRAPWGLARKEQAARDDLTTMTISRDAWAAAHKDAAGEVVRWRTAYERLDSSRRDDAAAMASAIDARATAAAARCVAAFDSGFAAGRALRGTSDDPHPDPVPAGAGAGVVRDDFRDAFRAGGGNPPRP